MRRISATVVCAVVVSGSAACRLLSSDTEVREGWYGPGSSSGSAVRPRVDSGASSAHQPVFFPTVHQEDAPPPISGGTLTLSADRRRAFVADPDRDRLHAVDLASKTVTTVALAAHDEPGRVVIDDLGHVHVALRGGAAVVTLDGELNVLARRDACVEPRGLDVDTANRRVLLACASGELVALSIDDPTAAAQTLATLDRDLRDIVVQGTHVFVSRFRSAEVLELDATLAVVRRHARRADVSQTTRSESVSMVAFRMLAAEPGEPSPTIVHERGSTGVVPTSTGTYYGPPPGDDFDEACSGGGGAIVFSAVTRIDGPSIRLPGAAVLPVDAARDGDDVVVVAAGNAHTPSLPQLFVVKPAREWGECDYTTKTFFPTGQATSVAVVARGSYVVLSREPAQLELLPSGEKIALDATSREDTGHAIFHANSSRGVACASCHPEGGDDGRTWTMGRLGELRRTHSLRGTLAGTAPYHWDGAMDDIPMISKEQMSGRMGGPPLDAKENDVLERWLFALPAPRPTRSSDDPSAVRGKALFERADFACATCHGGPRYTSNRTVDVDTGGRFQVPSLVGVAARAPFMHDGFATTLREVHHTPPDVTAADLDDLVAYLETL